MSGDTVRVQLEVSGPEKAFLSVRPLRAVPVPGSSDYEELENKPSIEGHELIGDSTLAQIGVGDVTQQQIDQIIYG